MRNRGRSPIGAALAAGLAGFLALGCAGEPDGAREPHGDLGCPECHTARVMGGAIAAAPPTACVECHPSGDLADSVTLAGARFAHAAHAEVGFGAPLPCGGCHTHREGQDPLQVAPGVCFSCHVTDEDSRVVTAAARLETPCLTCHVPDHTALTSSRAPINHQLVVQAGIGCTQCHFDVVRGGGSVLESRCETCHTDTPTRMSLTVATADSLHRVHLGPRTGMSCNRCHEPIRHEVVALASTVSLHCLTCHEQPHGLALGREPEWAAACTGCHSEAHQPIQAVYTGLVGGDRALPAKMFVARVSCDACHTEAELAATAPAARGGAINDACVECHGSAYARMLPRWSLSMERRTAAVSDYLSAAARDPRLRRGDATDSLIESATRDLGLVLEGNGLHNVPAADALLRSALTRVAAAYRAAARAVPRPPALGPDPATLSCGHCHYGIEAARDSVFGEPFDHADHILRADIACAECHSDADYFVPESREPDPEHGRTHVTSANCNACHHVDSELACTTCHEPSGVAVLTAEVRLTLDVQPVETPVERDVSFEHSDHRSLECEECHASRTDPLRVPECAACHSEHHSRASDCAACHGELTTEAHTVESHFTCAECHDRSTLEELAIARPFCLSCHTELGDHRPGRECAPCHMQLSPAEVRSRILEP